MTRLIGCTGIAAVLSLLVIAQFAHGAGPTPMKVLPNRNTIAPQRNMTNPALTEYICPGQIKVQWAHKMTTYVAGGWSEVQVPLLMDYVFHAPAQLTNGQISCDYLPSWFHGNPASTVFDVLLSQATPGTCHLRTDRRGVECRNI